MPPSLNILVCTLSDNENKNDFLVALIARHVSSIFDTKCIPLKSLASQPWTTNCQLLIIIGDKKEKGELTRELIARINGWKANAKNRIVFIGSCFRLFGVDEDASCFHGCKVVVKKAMKGDLNLLLNTGKSIQFKAENDQLTTLQIVQNNKNDKDLEIIAKYTSEICSHTHDDIALAAAVRISNIVLIPFIPSQSEEASSLSPHRGQEGVNMIDELVGACLNSLQIPTAAIIATSHSNSREGDTSTDLLLYSNDQKCIERLEAAAVRDGNGTIHAEQAKFRVVHEHEQREEYQSNSNQDTNDGNSSILTIVIMKERPDSFSKIPLSFTIIHTQSITSTQTLLLDNPLLSLHFLPQSQPTILIAEEQVQGRGRKSNKWTSLPGCLQFSMIWRHGCGVYGLVLVQYLAALCMCLVCDEALIADGSAAFSRVKVKWPNDIYLKINSDHVNNVAETGLCKIGGVLVNSQLDVDGKSFVLIIGIGVNIEENRFFPSLSNNHPNIHPNVESKASIKKTDILAAFTRTWPRMYAGMIANGFPFELYYDHWLHGEQRVWLDEDRKWAVIKGINSDGYLVAESVKDGDFTISAESEFKILLEPDGNSFDMTRNLIKRKL